MLRFLSESSIIHNKSAPTFIHMIVITHKKLAITLLLLATFILNACAFEKIKPWHRSVLAQERTQLVPDMLENEADEHIYFSKEAGKGGQGVGGGGCGCN